MGENQVYKETAEGIVNETSLQPPHELNLTGNVFVNYCRFEKDFQVYMKATGAMDSNDEDGKIDVLLKVIGNDAKEIIRVNKLHGETLEEVLKNLKTYFERKKYTMLHRYKMSLAVQEENETIEQYVTRLKTLAEPCEFGVEKDNQIRDRLVFGLRNKNWRDNLFKGTELSLNEAMSLCHTWEIGEMEKFEAKETKSKDEQEGIDEFKNNNKLRDSTTKSTKGKTVRDEEELDLSKKRFMCLKCGHLHGLKECPAFGEVCYICQKFNHFANKCKFRDFNLNGKRMSCVKCGQFHEVNECPAFGRTCFNCNKYNHFANQCRVKSVTKEVQSEDKQTFLNGIKPINRVTKDLVKNNWNVSLKIEKNDFCQFKLDTGSSVNLLPYSLFRKFKCFNDARINKSKLKLLPFSNNETNILGCVDLQCAAATNDNYKSIRFFLINHAGSCILGLQTCIDLNLIREVELSQRWNQFWSWNNQIKGKG